jgi:alpha-glucosidase
MGPWWRSATFYQIYVRSWRDTNGDGIGDLPGVTSGLDYLSSLGVTAVWLSPTMPSPNTDWGYDVSDYYSVHPDLGTPEDLDELIRQAAERGIRILLDLVPNHTSSAHPWFVDALSGKQAAHRDWYVWAPPRPGGGPPNNWVSSTGASAWTLEERSGEYYLHNFLPTQPDLNWWNALVHEEFERVLRYWFDRGVAGFRIDVAHGLYKDALLRDDPPAGPSDYPALLRDGLKPTYSSHRPEVHAVYQRWRQIAETYEPERLLLGETWEFEFDRLAAYYGREEPELQLAFNFPFVLWPFSSRSRAEVVEATLAALPEGATPVWTGSNHDLGRFPTRWCGGDQRAIKTALLLMATLPGSLVLYYGDELGMADVEVPVELQVDQMSLARPGHPSRDRARTPMPWTPGKNGGFTTPAGRPWLPMGEHATVNAESEEPDPASVLNFWRELAKLRSNAAIGQLAPMECVHLDDQVWAYRVGPATTVANLSPSPARLRLEVGGARALVATGPTWEAGKEVPGQLSLGPWESLVLGA